MVDEVIIKTEETGVDKPQEPAKQETKTTEKRPDWLPEKFKHPEELGKAYKELESQFTKQKQEEASKKEEPKEESKESLEINQNEAKEAVENVGLNFEQFSEEYNKNGSLSDDTYNQLEAKGIPKGVVDSYIAGQQALLRTAQNQVYESVGGKESYTEMITWAKQSLSQDEIAAFNDSVNSSNQAQINLAVQGLKARYQSSEGKDPSLLGGKSVAQSSAYENWSQVTADMGTKEYAKDPAFRQEVQDKLARSNL